MESLEEYEKQGGENRQGGLADFFGGGGGFQKGHNYQVELKVTLKELYLGTTKKVSLQRNEICHDCSGTGAHNGEVE
jgi:DnaJ-class molecular chaperone